MTKDFLQGLVANHKPAMTGSITEVVASEGEMDKGLFAVAKLNNGKYAAIWQLHHAVGTLDELKAGFLNVHELSLLPK